MKNYLRVALGIIALSAMAFSAADTWQSKFVTQNPMASLTITRTIKAIPSLILAAWVTTSRTAYTRCKSGKNH
jgi:hypothetical protein